MKNKSLMFITMIIIAITLTVTGNTYAATPSGKSLTAGTMHLKKGARARADTPGRLVKRKKIGGGLDVTGSTTAPPSTPTPAPATGGAAFQPVNVK